MTTIVKLSRTLGASLREKRLTLAVAESCTGGMVGAALTEIPGASDYFRGGVIAYDNRIKNGVLKVPKAILERYGAVSSQTVISMARGVQKLMNADCAVAVSGVAGPGGGTEEKPVGLVYIGIAVKGRCESFECRFRGTRRKIREQAVAESLRRLIDRLTQAAGRPDQVPGS